MVKFNSQIVFLTDLQEKIVPPTFIASYILLGAEGNAERVQEGLLPSKDFPLRCVPTTSRERLGCWREWVAEWVDLIPLFKLCLANIVHGVWN